MMPSPEERSLIRQETACVYRATIFQEVQDRGGRRQLWVFGRMEDRQTGEPTGAPVLVGQLVGEALTSARAGGLLRVPAGKRFGRWLWDDDLLRLDEAQLSEFRRWVAQGAAATATAAQGAAR